MEREKTWQNRPIQRLPEEVVGKIAAGEVVESPAAALKELIENSVDAGATAITVETREGGIAYFRVTDNGCGIPSEDIRMAFERHATSKIRSSDELFDVHSLGFRGEALASIAAVAKVTLTTRTAREDRGVKAVNIGGLLKPPEDAASPEGTTIVVQELFFNTPARLKFLKKPSVEGSRVADLVLRMLLSNPGVSFRLIQNEKQVYHSPGDGKLRSAVFSVLGREVTEQLHAVEYAEGGVRVEGFVGIGAVARGNRAQQSFFVNGRYVRSAPLTQALEIGCRERVLTGQFPICVLHLHIPPALVDVNVHPNKLEVRFSDEPLLQGILERAVREALMPSSSMTENALAAAPRIAWNDAAPAREPGQVQTREIVPPPEQVRLAMNMPAQLGAQPEASASLAGEASASTNAQADSGENPTTPPIQAEAAQASAQPEPRFADVVQDFFASMPAPAVRVHQSASPIKPPTQVLGFGAYPDDTRPAQSVAPSSAEAPRAPEPPAIAAPEPELAPYRVLGAVFRTYILIEQGETMLLIDQHAAHERLLYERLMRSLEMGQGSQELLVAQVVSVGPAERERLLAFEDIVRDAGYSFDFFGEDAVRISAVPVILGEPEVRAGFLQMLDSLGELRLLSTREKRREAIVQMSCKRAVKGGDALAPAEIEALLREMQRSEAPPTCPHGRPLVVVLTKQELEKRFKRIV